MLEILQENKPPHVTIFSLLKLPPYQCDLLPLHLERNLQVENESQNSFVPFRYVISGQKIFW
jgi:hypothetical protein